MNAARTQPAPKSANVVFLGKQQVALQPQDLGQPGAGQARIRTVCSLMSTGTENIVFNRLFEPGSHWDNWVKYPFTPGYSTIATVEAVGAGVTALKVGDTVATRSPHASAHLLDAAQCYPVPAGVDPRQAAWFALAKICFMGARAAEYQLGD